MLTGKDGRFQQLNELVDLDEHVDSHFKIGAGKVSSARCNTSRKQLTRLEVNGMLARMLELKGKVRRSRRRCGTKL